MRHAKWGNLCRNLGFREKKSSIIRERNEWWVGGLLGGYGRMVSKIRMFCG